MKVKATVVNSSNGITVERNEKEVFKISGDFKVPFDELPKKKTRRYSQTYIRI